MSQAPPPSRTVPGSGNLRWLWLSGLVLALDQLTKQAALHLLLERQMVNVFPGLNFTLVFNPGAAFSFLGEASGWQRWFLSLVGLGVSAVLVVLLRNARPCPWRLAAGYALVLGGALGNVIDRLRLGVVVDFVDIYYERYHWPAFNVADSAICIGALLLVLQAFAER